MLENTYLKWLGKEVVAAKYALLIALDKRDSLLYIEEPELKEEYMQKIGIIEEQVLKLELEVSMQEKKKMMIQTAINRREPIDLEVIERELEMERANRLQRLNETYKAGMQSEQTLTAEEKEELQKLYKEIVRDFHPQLHTDMTQTQKDLYQKALDAYKRQNLEVLRLIHEMLFDTGDGELTIEMSFDFALSEYTEESEIKEIAKSLMEDYSLAEELYPCFEAMEEDTALINAKDRYEEKQEAILQEIEEILKRFPFVAKETLQDEERVKEYLKNVDIRMNSAKTRIKELESEIAVMIGE